MNSHRIRGTKRKIKASLYRATKDEAQNKNEENSYDSCFSDENEEAKKDFSIDAEENKQQINYKKLYERKEKEWLEQKDQLEQEINTIKSKPEYKSNEFQSISYDAD